MEKNKEVSFYIPINIINKIFNEEIINLEKRREGYSSTNDWKHWSNIQRLINVVKAVKEKIDATIKNNKMITEETKRKIEELEESRKRIEELDKQLGILSTEKRKLNDLLLEEDVRKHKEIFESIVGKVFYYESDSSVLLIKPISCTEYHIYNMCRNNSTYNLPKEIVETWDAVYKEEDVIMNIGFNVRISKDGIFYNTDTITDFVKGITGTILKSSRVGGYSYSIKEIIFDRTGCQGAETKITDWSKVWDKYQELKNK